MTESKAPKAEDLVDALRAVREAIDIPHAATVGDEKTRDKILIDRVMHAVTFLDLLDEPDRLAQWLTWSTDYLRERLAGCPAEGYKTWDEVRAELAAAKSAEAGK